MPSVVFRQVWIIAIGFVMAGLTRVAPIIPATLLSIVPEARRSPIPGPGIVSGP